MKMKCNDQQVTTIYNKLYQKTNNKNNNDGVRLHVYFEKIQKKDKIDL